MNLDVLIEYVTTQAPIFLIAVMGLFVAGLALAFGICLTYYLSRNRS